MAIVLFLSYLWCLQKIHILQPHYFLLLHTLFATFACAGNYNDSIFNLNRHLISILSPQPKNPAIGLSKSVDPEKKSHSFGERPFIIGEKHPNTVIFVIIDKVKVRGDCSFLKASIKQSEAMTDHRNCKLIIIVGLSQIVGDKLEFWGFESANSANLIEDRGTKVNIFLNQFPFLSLFID